MFIYQTCISHTSYHQIPFNYFIALKDIYPLVRLDGKRMSLSVALNIINSLTGTSIHKTSCMQDFSCFALDKTLDKDEKGKKCMEQFAKDMQEYQAQLDKQDIDESILQPKNLSISMHF